MDDDPEARIAELERQRIAREQQLRMSSPEATRTPDPQSFSSPGPVPERANPDQQSSLPPGPEIWQPPPRSRSGGLRAGRWVRLIRGVAVIGFAGWLLITVFHVNPFDGGPQDLQSADGLTHVIDEVRKEFGDTMAYELRIYPEHAVIERADPSDRRVRRDYRYRSGEWSEWGAPSSVSLGATLVDVSKFDAAGMSATLAEAPKTLDIPHPDLTYLEVEGSGAGTNLSIHASGALTGYMDVNPDGSVKQLHPPS